MLTIWGYRKGQGGRFHFRRDTAEHVEVALDVAREWIEDGLSVVTVSRDEGIGDWVLARLVAPAAGQVVIVMPAVAVRVDALPAAA